MTLSSCRQKWFGNLLTNGSHVTRIMAFTIRAVTDASYICEIAQWPSADRAKSAHKFSKSKNSLFSGTLIQVSTHVIYALTRRFFFSLSTSPSCSPSVFACFTGWRFLFNHFGHSFGLSFTVSVVPANKIKSTLAWPLGADEWKCLSTMVLCAHVHTVAWSERWARANKHTCTRTKHTSFALP